MLHRRRRPSGNPGDGAVRGADAHPDLLFGTGAHGANRRRHRPAAVGDRRSIPPGPDGLPARRPGVRRPGTRRPRCAPGRGDRRSRRRARLGVDPVRVPQPGRGDRRARRELRGGCGRSAPRLRDRLVVAERRVRRPVPPRGRDLGRGVQSEHPADLRVGAGHPDGRDRPGPTDPDGPLPAVPGRLRRLRRRDLPGCERLPVPLARSVPARGRRCAGRQLHGLARPDRLDHRDRPPGDRAALWSR